MEDDVGQQIRVEGGIASGKPGLLPGFINTYREHLHLHGDPDSQPVAVLFFESAERKIEQERTHPDKQGREHSGLLLGYNRKYKGQVVGVEIRDIQPSHRNYSQPILQYDLEEMGRRRNKNPRIKDLGVVGWYCVRSTADIKYPYSGRANSGELRRPWMPQLIVASDGLAHHFYYWSGGTDPIPLDGYYKISDHTNNEGRGMGISNPSSMNAYDSACMPAKTQNTFFMLSLLFGTLLIILIVLLSMIVYQLSQFEQQLGEIQRNLSALTAPQGVSPLGDTPTKPRLTTLMEGVLVFEAPSEDAEMAGKLPLNSTCKVLGKKRSGENLLLHVDCYPDLINFGWIHYNELGMSLSVPIEAIPTKP